MSLFTTYYKAGTCKGVQLTVENIVDVARALNAAVDFTYTNTTLKLGTSKTARIGDWVFQSGATVTVLGEREAQTELDRWSTTELAAFADGSRISIASAAPANLGAVLSLLNMPEGDGRSGWHWFALADGSLVLGFFPQKGENEDGHALTEDQREMDFHLAANSESTRYLYATLEDLGAR